MSNRKYKAEQIVTVLRQIEVQIANGKTAPPGACNPFPPPKLVSQPQAVM